MYINRTRRVLTIVVMLHHTILLTRSNFLASMREKKLNTSDLLFFDFSKASSINERIIHISISRSIYIYKSIIDD